MRIGDAGDIPRVMYAATITFTYPQAPFSGRRQRSALMAPPCFRTILLPVTMTLKVEVRNNTRYIAYIYRIEIPLRRACRMVPTSLQASKARTPGESEIDPLRKMGFEL